MKYQNCSVPVTVCFNNSASIHTYMPGCWLCKWSFKKDKTTYFNLTWMVLVILNGVAAAACDCVPPMLLLRLSLSRASIILLLLLLSCGVVLPLTFSPCTLGVNCLIFTPAKLLTACICICGTSVWLCTWCVTAVFSVVCGGTVNGLCPCLRELIIWRASCTPPPPPAAPPLPRILKRASFWPSFSLASLTWKPEWRQEEDWVWTA